MRKKSKKLQNVGKVQKSKEAETQDFDVSTSQVPELCHVCYFELKFGSQW